MVDRKPLIVVAREDSQARASLRSLLSRQGYEVAAFPTISESSDVIRYRKPALLLADRPVANSVGVAILERIKILSPHSEVVFLPRRKDSVEGRPADRSDQGALILRIVERLVHRIPMEVLFTRQSS